MVIDKVRFVLLDNEKGGCIDFVKIDTAPFYFGITCYLQSSDRTTEWFNTFEEVENTIMLVRWVDGIAI